MSNNFNKKIQNNERKMWKKYFKQPIITELPYDCGAKLCGFDGDSILVRANVNQNDFCDIVLDNAGRIIQQNSVGKKCFEPSIGTHSQLFHLPINDWSDIEKHLFLSRESDAVFSNFDKSIFEHATGVEKKILYHTKIAKDTLLSLQEWSITGDGQIVEVSKDTEKKYIAQTRYFQIENPKNSSVMDIGTWPFYSNTVLVSDNILVACDAFLRKYVTATKKFSRVFMFPREHSKPN